jgi:hypothetical protein
VQINYSTIKKGILFVILCIIKVQPDLLNQKFLLRIDCKCAKYILKKRCSKYCIKTNFCAMSSYFDFDIEYIKGYDNSIPDFLTCEFL